MRRILVTGAFRGGTTWVGKILAEAPHVGYILEPFNLNPSVNFYPKTSWEARQFICDENADLYRDAVADMLSFKYPYGLPRLLRTPAGKSKLLRARGRQIVSRALNFDAIVKDPHAIFSAEWLAQEFGVEVLAVIRHPAAFYLSTKTVNWPFEFEPFSYSSLVRQPLLMDGYLKPFADGIVQQAEAPGDIITLSTLMWKCVYNTVAAYREAHRDWLFVRHEDISADPIRNFKSIYESLGLEYTQKIESKIRASTGVRNPVDQEPGRNPNAIRRNSFEVRKRWKSKLTSAEISRIRAETEGVSEFFYSDCDW